MGNIYTKGHSLSPASKKKESASPEDLQASQKFEAFINALSLIVQKYGKEILENVDGAA